MKFVFFGSIPIATECLKVLVSKFEKKNIFVVTDKNYSTEEGITVYNFAQNEELKIFELQELENSDQMFDYGFSLRFNKIISKTLLSKFEYGIINFHGGPLPNYRGSANHIFAILNEEEEFGPTFHYIDEGIDTGPVIQSRLFKVSESDTGYDVFKRTLVIGKILFKNIVQKIAKGDVIEAVRQDLSRGVTYKIKDLSTYQYVDLSTIDEAELIKRIRAFHHPTKKGVITDISGRKVEMRLIK